MKRSIRLSAIIAITLIILSGCLRENGADPAEPLQTPQEVTLKYATWMQKGEDKPTLQAFMEKYPHIKVVSEVLDGANYDNLLKTKLLSNDAPDVFMFMDGEYRPFVNQGWLRDVTHEPAVVRRQEARLVQAYLTPDSAGDAGKIFGGNVSSSVFDVPVYYNKKLFAKLGIRPPETLEQFYELCGKIRQAGISPVVIGIKDRWPIGQIMYPFMYTDILGKYDKLGEDLYFNRVKPSDVYRESLTFLETMMSLQYIGRSSLNLTYDQSVKAFVKGEAAMMPMGTWLPELDAVKQASPDRFELGAFSFPYPEFAGKIHVYTNLDRNLGVYSQTKHPEEALLLFNYFLDPPHLKSYLESQSLLTLDSAIGVKTHPVLDDYLASHRDPQRYEVHYPSQSTIGLNVPDEFNRELSATWDRIIGGSTALQQLEWLDGVYEQAKDNARGQALAVNWSFNTDLDSEGWTRPGGEFTVENGQFNLYASRNYSGAIYSANDLSLPGNNRFVRIRMRTATPAVEASLMFITAEDQNWNAQKTMTFMTVPGEYHEYVLDMWTVPGWKEGTIQKLILKPFISEGAANIDYISIADQ